MISTVALPAASVVTCGDHAASGSKFVRIAIGVVGSVRSLPRSALEPSTPALRASAIVSSREPGDGGGAVAAIRYLRSALPPMPPSSSAIAKPSLGDSSSASPPGEDPSGSLAAVCTAGSFASLTCRRR